MLHHSSSHGLIVADIPEDGADAGADVLLEQGLVLALAFAELVVDPPDIFGLLVDQHGAAGIAARLEEGAALGREVVIHADIGDDIFAFVVLALHAQAELRANRRARAVGGEHIVGLEAIVAGRRGDAERHAVIAGNRCR